MQEKEIPMQSIGIRLNLAFLCIVFFLVIQGILALYNARHASEVQQRTWTQELRIKTLQERLAQTRLTVFKLLGTMNPDEMDRHLAEYREGKQIAITYWIEQNLPDPLFMESWATYETIIENHYNFFAKTARDLIYTTSKEQYESLSALLKEKAKALEAENHTKIQQLHESTLFITIALCTAALLTAFGWGFALKHSLTDRKRAEEALRESETKYRTLFESSTEGVLLVKDVILDCNQQVCDLFGYTKQDLLGRPFPACVSEGQTEGKHLADAFTHHAAILPPGEKTVFECMAQKHDGKEMQIEVTMKSIMVRGESILLITLRDITENRKMQEELLKSRKMESIGLLAGGIAHDFNNLLTAILGNLSLAKMSSGDDSSLDEYLTACEKASLQARGLTQQLLTFSKGGAPVKKTASLSELIQETAAFVLRGSNVRCEFDFSPDLWYADVDKDQFVQVFHNLILNADQAMPEGGVIRIRCTNVSQPLNESVSVSEQETSSRIKITVSDEGHGIAKEHLTKVFDPYFSTKPKGSGLGLATAYSIINRHGGNISVESKPGQGTQFTVFVPASQSPAPIQDQPSKSAAQQ
ncbi:PAS domain S-box protein, partial [bacterium]|nr:PAS domain S-box protein [bacterium]